MTVKELTVPPLSPVTNSFVPAFSFCLWTGWSSYLENQENKLLGTVEAGDITLRLAGLTE